MPSFKYLNGTNTIGTGTYKFKHINCEAPATNPYLTFSSPYSFTLNKDSKATNNGIVQYSTDATTWDTFTTTSVSAVLAASGLYEIYMRGEGNTFVKGNTRESSPYFKMSGTSISCDGNIENLLDYATVANGNHPTMVTYCYYSMFSGCTSLTSCPTLPATTLAAHCYDSMFRDCTSLTSCPTLPATTLAGDCYASMFYGCTSLTSCPALPATTLATTCYNAMFSKCTSLTSCPALPATTLADYCYCSMFYKCTSLTSCPTLPATTLADECYYHMFSGCTSLKLSTVATGTYTVPFRVPTLGTGTAGNRSLDDMFLKTGGTFTGTPSINTTYYLSV